MDEMPTRAEYVQPIMLLVDKEQPADATDAIRAVARASVGLWRRDGSTGPTWDEWLSGPFAKSVRRASPKTFAKVLGSHGPADYELVEVGAARAAAFRPVRSDAMPPLLRALQVSGTELPELISQPAPVGAPDIVLNTGLGMTTGKAAAQAAHALFLYAITSDDFTDIDCGIRYADGQAFDTLAADESSGSHIVDAGRTEIEPGSMTAFVHSPGRVRT
jgi:hypothetical protein